MDPQTFAKKCREARTACARVFVVLHFFAGVARSGDVEEHFRNEAAPHFLDFIFCSVDLLNSADLDLSQPWLFIRLSSLIEEGLIDVVLGRPPCSTWSALRWLPVGPHPLRFRWAMPWGRDDLTLNERAHCALANIVSLNTLALMECCSLRGDAHLLEHPADPLVVQAWNRNPIQVFEEALPIERCQHASPCVFQQRHSP